MEVLESRVMLSAVSRPLALPVRIGANYVDWWYDQFETAASDQRITKLANNTDANTIEIVQTWYMDTGTDNAIYQHPTRSLRDSGVIHAIQLAKSLGLSVILKPHVDVIDETYWRGSITPTNTNAWFNSYKSFINHYADMAKTYGVEMYCVGTELKSMNGSNYTSQWNSVIDGIEQRFDGQLTYAANWDDFKSVQFWNRMDVIGIDQYSLLGPQFQYEATPSVATLVERWKPIVDDIRGWRASQGYAQPVMMTEIGYRGVSDTHRTFASTSTTEDQAAQKRAFDAATQVWTSEDWMAGVLWWAWHQDPVMSFSPMDRLAESSLRTGSISGTIFSDTDGDGVHDAGENGLSNWRVYLDANNNNVFDASEYSVFTNASGQYSIANLLVGNYKVRAVFAAGFEKSSPSGSAGHDIYLDGGQNVAGKNFGAKGTGVPDNTLFKENFDAIPAGTVLPDPTKQPQIWATDAGDTYVAVSSLQSRSGSNSARMHDQPLSPSQNYYPQMLVSGLGPTATSGYTTQAVDISFDYFVPAVADQPNYFADGLWLGLANNQNYDLIAPMIIKGDGIFIVNDGGSGGGFIGTVVGGQWHHVAIRFTGLFGGNISFTTKLDDLPAVTTTRPAPPQTRWNNFRWELRDNAAAKDVYIDNIDIHLSTGAGSIAGNIFNDPNSNGVKDAGETGVKNWVIYLDVNNNNQLDGGETSTTTDTSGAYIFTGVASGTHRVRQQLAGGYRKTLPGSGVPGYDVTIQGAQEIGGKNFGVTSNILLAGKVFNDANANGVQDAGESGIAGVKVDVISNGTIVATRTTDVGGAWQVKGLSAGSGQAKITLPGGYSATQPIGAIYSGSMSAGQQNANLNFGIRLATPSPAMTIAPRLAADRETARGSWTEEFLNELL